MQDCEVRENCKNFLQAGDKCWCCESYNLYLPEDKRILSPRQVRLREERKADKKRKKQSEASRRGKRAKRKGYRAEKKVAQMLDGERVPLSGALGGKYSNDVIAKGWKLEVKSRKDSWKEIRRWLDDEREKPDAVVLVPDREEPIVCMRLSKFKLLLSEEGQIK